MTKDIDYKICSKGDPCWKDYIYIGPEPGVKGSCISEKNLCKKKTARAKGYECKVKLLEEKKITCDNNKSNKKTENKNFDINDYKNCLSEAQNKFQNNKLKLCPRGYCTAKHTFEVYPSAYANGYATSVCKGQKPDALDKTFEDKEYMKKLEVRKSKKKEDSLQRWYKEEWVNICEKGKGPGGFAVCGSGDGIDNPDKYPYCRAYYKLDKTDVVTVEELTKYLTKEEFENLKKEMCAKKRSLKQGIDGKPTRINLPKWVYKKIKNERNKSNQKAGGNTVKIPLNVKQEAKKGIILHEKGFAGGTKTGWDRGYQLSNDSDISVNDLADMRTWFARHGPDAKNGGTSYPGYCKWLADNKNLDDNQLNKNSYRGAVSWLIWGGNPAYVWLKTPEIRKLIEKKFPKRKKSPKNNNLGC
tara:strand:- start:3033 stop:4274 length:1242 start_codon:yes stop_codon:yes gene_type:complete